ncbi:hypothetical protein HO564_08190 [Streptococcus suis]|nr:hypothetical protein [Streptococcus suis]
MMLKFRGVSISDNNKGQFYIGLYAEVQKGTATLDVDRMYNDCEGRLTIIGNIYENPELVEG